MTDIEIALHGSRGNFGVEVEFRLPARGVSAVFGSSGAGKTTLLRALAGLERMSGRVRVADQLWQSESHFRLPEARRVGYVFQEAALLPHLSVRENLGYAHRRAAGHRVGIDEVVDWLELGRLLHRSTLDLSGGERQRVAIARAIVSNPVLLLLDEPLAALDAKAKDGILGRLERIRDELRIPVIYVTHSLDEVARLADRVVWLDGGKVRALDRPEDLFARLDVGVAMDEQAASLVPARLSRHDDAYHLSELDTAWGMVRVRRMAAKPGALVRLQVRARDVSIALEHEPNTSILNAFPADVVELREVGPGEVLVRLECPGDAHQALLARVTEKSVNELGLRSALRVYARVKSVSVR